MVGKMNKTHQWIQSMTAILTVCITAGALYQLSLVQKALYSSANANIYTHELQLSQNLLADTTYYDYLYAGSIIDSAHPDYKKVSEFIALFSDFFEHVSLQQDNLPEGVWEAWKNWMLDVFEESPMLVSHYANNSEHYSPQIIKVFNEYIRRRKQ